MADQIRLRGATQEDAVSVAQLFRYSFTTALPHIPTLHSPNEDLAFFADVLASQQVCLAVDQQSEALLGFVAFHDGWVNHLYVHPDVQRSGIGRQLLTAAKEAHHHLQLWTFQANTKARAFYRGQGFIEMRQTDGSDNEELEPDVLLEWRRS